MTMKKPSVSAHTRWLPVAALLLLALIWGYSWVVMKVALDYVQPFTFAALRTFLGALALLLVEDLLLVHAQTPHLVRR